LVSWLFFELIACALEVESTYYVHVLLKFDTVLTKYFLKTLRTFADEISVHVRGWQAQVEVGLDFGDLKFD
jgi:hypothetical protein